MCPAPHCIESRLWLDDASSQPQQTKASGLARRCLGAHCYRIKNGPFFVYAAPGIYNPFELDRTMISSVSRHDSLARGPADPLPFLF